MAKKASELKPTDEVVVTLGAKQESKNGKIVTIEKEKQVIMTKAGFDAIQIEADTNDYSATLDRTVTLAGIPKYKKESDSMAGSIKELEKVEALASEVTEPAA